ncbi:hypothetical protein N7475_003426 [Penicillium sp. IBT 31633x]|nr:hypothetical protein N7475_003426 [Penicillium sp. IBT 31633x]
MRTRRDLVTIVAPVAGVTVITARIPSQRLRPLTAPPRVNQDSGWLEGEIESSSFSLPSTLNPHSPTLTQVHPFAGMAPYFRRKVSSLEYPSQTGCQSWKLADDGLGTAQYQSNPMQHDPWIVQDQQGQMMVQYQQIDETQLIDSRQDDTLQYQQKCYQTCHMGPKVCAA